MATNQGRIRIARGKTEHIQGITPPAGNLVYDKDKQYLYVGNGNDSIQNLAPITTNRLITTGLLNIGVNNTTNKSEIKSTNSIDFYISSNKKVSIGSNNIKAEMPIEVKVPNNDFYSPVITQ